jgi:hypothetical protein
LDAEHSIPTQATRRAAAGLSGVSSNTWWAYEPCAGMQGDKWAAGRIWALSPANCYQAINFAHGKSGVFPGLQTAKLTGLRPLD